MRDWRRATIMSGYMRRKQISQDERHGQTRRALPDPSRASPEPATPSATLCRRHSGSAQMSPPRNTLSPPPFPLPLPSPILAARRVFPQEHAPRQAPSRRRLPSALPDPAHAAPHPDTKRPTRSHARPGATRRLPSVKRSPSTLPARPLWKPAEACRSDAHARTQSRKQKKGRRAGVGDGGDARTHRWDR